MKQGDFYRKENCRLCGSLSLEKSLVLTPTPPGNNFLKKIEEGKEEREYPLELYFCTQCSHIQLGHVVDPSFLFQNNYSYVSSTSSVETPAQRLKREENEERNSLLRDNKFGEIDRRGL